MVILKPGLGYLDKHISKLILKTVPFWNKLNITPNYLTTLSLLILYQKWKTKENHQAYVQMRKDTVFLTN